MNHSGAATPTQKSEWPAGSRSKGCSSPDKIYVMNFGVKPGRELLGHAVASAIRDEILTGEVQHGEQLRLAPLAEKLNMSITPVREALLLLAQDGCFVQVTG